MQIEIRSRPSFANLLVRLARGDRIVAESDAMASMSSAITLKTRWNGGFLAALLRRFFGGESLFVNEFSTDSSGELVLTQPWPGDIACVELKGSSLFLQPGAFVACDPDVQLGVGYAGLRSFIAREGLFRLRVSGQGRVWFGAYGGIVAKDIEGGYVVDSSHLVAYEPSVQMRIGFAGSLLSSLLSQEGLVMRLRGPGRIWLQTRSMEGLAAWVNSHL
ncbi:MAG: TIGR00266 family protein [Polyangiales bacterium]